jgi:hypothetical protein
MSDRASSKAFHLLNELFMFRVIALPSIVQCNADDARCYA